MDNALDMGQLEKRLEWLDNERRNDKTIIAALQSKLDTFDTENSKLKSQIKDLESGIARINTVLARQEQFELEISDLRKELNRQVDEFKTDVQEKHVQTNRNQQKIEDINEDLIAVRKRVQEFDGFSDLLGKRKEEDIRLARLIEELKSQVNEIGRFDEDYKRSLRMIEENRHQDNKRLTDLQGEVSAIRKRQDETRSKQDLVGDNLRKVENRIKDLQEAESERREAQTTFIEKVNMSQVERERTFKTWAERFDKMEQITANLEEEIVGLENTHRAVKQSQAALDEVTQRFDRRVNEITEVQRLNEDRFRQEWTTFKSDDQKRWANYTLSQEEQHREMNRSLENLSARITIIEDLLEQVQENFQQMGKNDLKRMQNLLNTFRESIENYDNIFKE
jgi:DNA repair exonuclease SbcCD ATPase subunit